MNTPERLTVALGERSYDIVIGEGLLARAGDLIAPVLPSKRAILVADASVAKRYAASLMEQLRSAGVRVDCIEVPSGEASKGFPTFSGLLENLLALTPDRKTTLIALGGGVIGDLAGFVASVLLRGVPFIQIPTTLLAQVDSSVGGKTAINAKAGKNLIGSFYQPKLVLIDLAVLKTLPPREWLAGYAEIIKYGLIEDKDFYQWCLANAAAMLKGDTALLQKAVLVSCRTKARIVGEDERESDKRALLNLGHTFGHALEAELHYDGRLLHGEAVAIGMVMACRLSQRLGLIGPEAEKELTAHFASLGLPAKPIAGVSWDAHAIAAHFAGDKKTEGGKLNFVVLDPLGRARVEKNVDPKLAEEVVASFLGGM